jgi:hypothetical protein
MTLGEFLQRNLFGDERFTALIQLFGQQMAADMLNTAPHEAKRREGIHAAYSGFTEFTSLMSKFAEAAETLLNSRLSKTNLLRVTDTDAHRYRRHI